MKGALRIPAEIVAAIRIFPNRKSAGGAADIPVIWIRGEGPADPQDAAADAVAVGRIMGRAAGL